MRSAGLENGDIMSIGTRRSEKWMGKLLAKPPGHRCNGPSDPDVQAAWNYAWCGDYGMDGGLKACLRLKLNFILTAFGTVGTSVYCFAQSNTACPCGRLHITEWYTTDETDEKTLRHRIDECKDFIRSQTPKSCRHALVLNWNNRYDVDPTDPVSQWAWNSAWGGWDSEDGSPKGELCGLLDFILSAFGTVGTLNYCFANGPHPCPCDRTHIVEWYSTSDEETVRQRIAKCDEIVRAQSSDCSRLSVQLNWYNPFPRDFFRTWLMYDKLGQTAPQEIQKRWQRWRHIDHNAEEQWAKLKSHFGPADKDPEQPAWRRLFDFCREHKYTGLFYSTDSEDSESEETLPERHRRQIDRMRSLYPSLYPPQ